MGAINPQRVAKKVSQTIQRGELVDLEDIIASVGYAASTAKRSGMVTNTKAYKATMAIMEKPLLEGIQAEINRLKLAMSKKDLMQEDYRTLAYGMDIQVKNYQLLSGGATERQVFVLPAEIMTKNAIEPSVEKKGLLDNGLTEPSKPLL